MKRELPSSIRLAQNRMQLKQAEKNAVLSRLQKVSLPTEVDVAKTYRNQANGEEI